MNNEIKAAYAAKLDLWLPASAGTEQPFKSRSGARLLYCFNPATGQHAYLNCDTDLILTNEEAAFLMQL